MTNPSPYSQIFEVCGSPESLPGHSLERILTQVPGGQTEKEWVPVRGVTVRREVTGLIGDPTPESEWALVALSTVAEGINGS